MIDFAVATSQNVLKGFPDPDEVSRAVIAVVADAVKLGGVSVPRHRHRKAELIYAAKGVINCDVEGSLWIVPPHCAVWIPGGMRHSVYGEGDFASVCLFVETSSALPAKCCTVSVTPFLKELICRASRLDTHYDSEGRDGRLMSVLLDELAAAPVENLCLPMPSAPRLVRLAEMVRADPADRASAKLWAKRAAMSERSLSRLMLQDIGMSFGDWRRRLHVILAVQGLTAGASVDAIAAELGYESASSFVAMFRRTIGVPPARYARRVRCEAARGS